MPVALIATREHFSGANPIRVQNRNQIFGDLRGGLLSCFMVSELGPGPQSWASGFTTTKWRRLVAHHHKWQPRLANLRTEGSLRPEKATSPAKTKEPTSPLSCAHYATSHTTRTKKKSLLALSVCSLHHVTTPRSGWLPSHCPTVGAMTPRNFVLSPGLEEYFSCSGSGRIRTQLF